MKKIHMPNGLNSVGFNNNDGPSLAKGTLPQHRVTNHSPREANENDGKSSKEKKSLKRKRKFEKDLHRSKKLPKLLVQSE